MISKKELERMYFGQRMSQNEIAKKVGVYKSTIRSWMRRYKIKSRTISEAKLNVIFMPSKEELEEMYLEYGMNQYEIADKIGVSQGTVNNRMREYGIVSRYKLIDVYVPSEDELRQMYYEQEMSLGEIAKEIGVSCGRVHWWMTKYEIRLRTISEAMVGKFAGENSPGWQGGISFEPYCKKFNNEFKESVRKRDDCTCQLCGYKQSSDGRKLDVHHIHYDKENCYPDVIALCRSCNSKVNSDRDYWEQYFENQLLKRGLFCWSISREMIL